MSQLAPEEIYIPPHLQPLNPEDEDDVVPDQHAAFGIQRATQGKREASWRDLGLDELVRRGPGEGAGEGTQRGGGAVSSRGQQGRRDEPVRLALRRRPGAGSAAATNVAGGEQQIGGGAAGNGLPR